VSGAAQRAALNIFGKECQRFLCLERHLTCPVIFGPDESLYLLGATALEIFGVDADPTTKRLKPILGHYWSSRVAGDLMCSAVSILACGVRRVVIS
jgi:hypothetical protein